MKKQNFRQWIKCAGVRAIKTIAQTFIATIRTSAVLADVHWLMVASAEVGYLEKKSNKDLDSKTANVGKNNQEKCIKTYLK